VNAVVFLGPTLSVEAARRELDAEYWPPAAQGDVLAALASGPRAIGIVDGFFDRVPSVWHKEILFALESGCHVFGASSMGALRAAELHDFGMRGVGEVFAAYRDGALEDDDEVAVLHGDADSGYREMSDAMVNIRDVVVRAREASLFDAKTAAELLRAVKAMHYPERSFRAVTALMRQGGLSETVIENFESLVSRTVPSKRRDAFALLAEMRRFLETDPPPHVPSFRVEPTVFFEALRAEVAARAPLART
jgi:hypothetical protein